MGGVLPSDWAAQTNRTGSSHPYSLTLVAQNILQSSLSLVSGCIPTEFTLLEFKHDPHYNEITTYPPTLPTLSA